VQKVIGIVPARFNSTRFPGKPLAILSGKAIIQRVYENVRASKIIEDVYVATDDIRIKEAVESFGGKAVMTSPDHESGTDRIAEVARSMDCDIVVNVQGDEPFILPHMIDDTIQTLIEDNNASISTLAVRMTREEDLLSPHVVKVVTDRNGYAIYFSRSPIPFYRDEWDALNRISLVPDKTIVLKHIGIYCYRRNVLLEFTSMHKSRLEEIEKLEQLRAIEAGYRIRVKETEFDTIGIDTEEDLRKAEQWQSLYS